MTCVLLHVYWKVPLAVGGCSEVVGFQVVAFITVVGLSLMERNRRGQQMMREATRKQKQ